MRMKKDYFILFVCLSFGILSLLAEFNNALHYKKSNIAQEAPNVFYCDVISSNLANSLSTSLLD